jgi:hypothetical protein
MCAACPGVAHRNALATPHCCDGDVRGWHWQMRAGVAPCMVLEQHRRECLTHVLCGGAGCAGNGMRSPVSVSRGRLVLGRPSRTASGSSSWIESSIELAVTASFLVLSKKLSAVFHGGEDV